MAGTRNTTPSETGGPRPAAAGPFGQARALGLDIARTCGRRVWLVAALAAIAAVAEGAGLLMLAPVLRALGLVGDGGAGTGLLAAWGQALGLGGTLSLFVLLVLAAGAVVMAYGLASTALVLAYTDTLRRRLHQAVLGAAWGSPPLRRPAALAHALATEVPQCGYAVEQFLRVAAILAQVPALALVALALSPPLAAGAVLLAGALWLAMAPLDRRAHRLAATLAEAHRAVHAEVSDQLAGLRVLKVLRAERRRATALEGEAARLREARLRQARAHGLARLAQRGAAAAALALILWGGTEWAGMAVPDLLASVAVLARLMVLGSRLQESWRQVLRLLPAHAAVATLREGCLAAAEPPPDPVAPRLTREVRLHGVGFTHPGAPAPSLAGLSLVIPARATTALVGPSGAGKSTLADLLMGLVAPSEGVVTVDGWPLGGGARVAWRDRVGYVPQDPFLFNDTVRANLLLARPDADEAALHEALRQAAAGFVHRLPQGLDTVVGDRGTRLSGGERQRVALARALLLRPDLLVLDEATSALDEATEQRVLEAVAALHGQVTLVLVAHRRSTIALADHVIRLEGGRLAEPSAAPAPC